MSTVKAQIVEGVTGNPLANASITVVDKLGHTLHQGVMADAFGKFGLTSDALVGNYLLISYTGLQPVMIATDVLNDRDYKVVQLFASDLDAVIVTPGKKGKWGWWLLLGVIVIVAVSKKKKKKRNVYA